MSGTAQPAVTQPRLRMLANGIPFQVMSAKLSQTGYYGSAI
jgi:hypothetical protein